MKFRDFVFTGLLLLHLSCSAEEEMEKETPLPQLRIANAEIFEGDEDKFMDISVSLTGQHSGLVSTHFRTISGTAEANQDFTSVEDGTIQFQSGETSATIQINIIGDDAVENDETFQIELFDASQATITLGIATATIRNDDQNPVTIDVEIPETGYVSPDSYEGMTLVWSDEFQDDELNLESWSHEMGDGCPNLCGWGNNELEYYQPENTAIVRNEYLVIEAREERAGNRNYTSSRIISKGKKDFQYGRIDVRAVLPRGQGVWPAIWMLGTNIDQVGWPSCGEIDIMEIIGNMPARLHGTAHWQGSDGNHIYYGQHTDLDNGDFSDEFHVFSIVWTQNNIEWYLDNQRFNVLDISQAALSEFHHPFFFIFNIAVGGNWPGSPDANTEFPQHMIIDYVRVFQEE